MATETPATPPMTLEQAQMVLGAVKAENPNHKSDAAQYARVAAACNRIAMETPRWFLELRELVTALGAATMDRDKKIYNKLSSRLDPIEKLIAGRRRSTAAPGAPEAPEAPPPAPAPRAAAANGEPRYNARGELLSPEEAEREAMMDEAIAGSEAEAANAQEAAENGGAPRSDVAARRLAAAEEARQRGPQAPPPPEGEENPENGASS